MKFLVLVSLLVLSVSCGKNGAVDCFNGCTGSSNGSSGVEPDASILSKFEAVGTGLHGVNSLDFSTKQLNVQNDLSLVCDGSYGNNGDVGGAQPSKVLLTGDEQNGVIQLGHTKYIGASNPLCRDVSKEAYSFKIEGKTLTLCMVNYTNTDGSPKYCADYLKAE